MSLTLLRPRCGIVTFVAVIRHLIWPLALVVKGDLEVIEKGLGEWGIR